MAQDMTERELMNELIMAALNGVAKQYAVESTRADFHHTEPVIYPVAVSVCRNLAAVEAKLAGIEESQDQISYRSEVFMERIHELRAEHLARWGNKY